MKKRILLTLITLVVTQFAVAQDQNLDRAKRYFDRTYYSEAIPLYEAAIENNRSLEVIRNLADSYYFTNDLKNAQKYYRFLIKNFSKDINEEYYFRYAQTLKATNNYNEANQAMRDMYAKANNTAGVATLERDLKTLENITAIGERFKIKNLAINTENSEFGAVENGDNLIYSSGKVDPKLFSKVYKWNNEGYLNLVSIPLKNIMAKDSLPKVFSSSLNSKMHESSPVFSADGKTMYFTRNYTKNGNRLKNKEKVSVLQIFKAELVNGTWSNITSLPFNSADYSVEHPTVTADGTKMYFASDMPGGQGSFDLYVVDINNGSFGTPRNLGSEINTSRREQFPFIAKDGKLYFSSNGHEGFGSLDVFVANPKDGDFAKPLNVGLPVNTGVDDFAFNINSDTKEGYFTSNRKGGKGSDDIYSILETKDLIVEDCKQFIAGTITDKDTKLPIENAQVVLQDKDKNEIEKVMTTADGKYSFTVACETSYTVIGSKENYTTENKSFILQKDRNKINDGSLELKSLEVIKQEEIAAKEAEQKAVEEAKAKEKAIADEKRKVKEKEILEKEKDVVKDEKDRLVIKTEPIYFDYDLWYIRRDSKVILDRVVELMNKYPNMILEIGSHTDIRGGVTYNKVLSQNRAMATKDYLIDKGISESRIHAKGYGESIPVVKCASEESCSEEQHELNRRSEFVIKDL